MSDKTGSFTPENTTSALSHLAFCALAALGLARQDGIAGTSYAENLFLIRWLATAQKQKRFSKSVAIDIQWLLERGRRHGDAERPGWDNYVMDNREWKSGVMPTPSQKNGFYVEKTALNAAFTQDGSHLMPVHFHIIGDTAAFINVMGEYGLQARLIGSAPNHHKVALEPA
ncbi:hypothetical protein A8A01_01250 [Ewingella americana]|nr:hypothetical protein A8A01_01250 [Ewingella americana]